jgi:hypothetical protein
MTEQLLLFGDNPTITLHRGKWPGLVPLGFCEYGAGHPTEPHSNYFYADNAHGITQDISICGDCLKQHILQYYPNGRLAAYYRGDPPNTWPSGSDEEE